MQKFSSSAIHRIEFSLKSAWKLTRWKFFNSRNDKLPAAVPCQMSRSDDWNYMNFNQQKIARENQLLKCLNHYWNEVMKNNFIFSLLLFKGNQLRLTEGRSERHNREGWCGYVILAYSTSKSQWFRSLHVQSVECQSQNCSGSHFERFVAALFN